MAATYLPNYLAIYRDLRARPCAGSYTNTSPTLRWGGIIVKTSLNMIDTASSLVRACPSHPDGSSTSTLSRREFYRFEWDFH